MCVCMCMCVRVRVCVQRQRRQRACALRRRENAQTHSGMFDARSDSKCGIAAIFWRQSVLAARCFSCFSSCASLLVLLVLLVLVLSLLVLLCLCFLFLCFSCLCCSCLCCSCLYFSCCSCLRCSCFSHSRSSCFVHVASRAVRISSTALVLVLLDSISISPSVLAHSLRTRGVNMAAAMSIDSDVPWYGGAIAIARTAMHALGSTRPPARASAPRRSVPRAPPGLKSTDRPTSRTPSATKKRSRGCRSSRAKATCPTSSFRCGAYAQPRGANGGGGRRLAVDNWEGRPVSALAAAARRRGRPARARPRAFCASRGRCWATRPRRRCWS